MTQVKMQQVKELRERTQAGLNDCRGALVEAEGDMEAAVAIILKKGLAKSAKRAGALATEGVVAARVAEDRKSGVIVEVNIQTDFAARNQDFLAFVDDVIAVAQRADANADLGGEPSPQGGGTLEDQRKALVGRLGENVTVRRWNRLAVAGPGVVHSYVHMGGKVGVLLSVATEAAEHEAMGGFVDDTSMQIAAMTPQFVSRDAVTEASKAEQRRLFDAQLEEEGKPEAVRPKIVEGKLSKWMKEVCLLDQASVMDGDKSVEQVRAAVEQRVGAAVGIEGFVRYERGEGLASRAAGDDFAEEARRMAGQG